MRLLRELCSNSASPRASSALIGGLLLIGTPQGHPVAVLAQHRLEVLDGTQLIAKLGLADDAHQRAIRRLPAEAVAASAAEGELPRRQLGEEWRFARSAVLRWLSGSTVDPQSPESAPSS